MDSLLDRKRAERRAGATLGFLMHALVFVVAMGMILLINVMTSPAQLWFVWPLFVWAMALGTHGLGVLVFCHEGKTLERMVAREEARHT